MAKWLILVVFVWVIGMFLGATFEKHDTSVEWGGNTEVNTVSYLMNFSNATQHVALFGTLSVPLPNTEYFKTIFEVTTLQFSFINGAGYDMFYWIVLAPIAMGAILALVILVYGMVTGNLTWS